MLTHPRRLHPHQRLVPRRLRGRHLHPRHGRRHHHRRRRPRSKGQSRPAQRKPSPFLKTTPHARAHAPQGAGTVTIRDFTVVNAGKLYRSCGDCTNNEAKSPRHVVVENVRAFGMTSDLIGINPNFGDTASISGSCGTTKAVCREYKGVNKGEGDSEKLDTKGSCEGEQGKLEKLPECGAADETEGPVESAPEEEEPEEEEPDDAIPPIPTALVDAPVETSPTAPTTLLTKTKTIMPTATDAPSGSVAKWAQCGGIGYTGATSCSSGTCKAWNPYYSQCL